MNQKLLTFLAIFLFAISAVHAVAPSNKVTIASEPSTVADNQDIYITWTLSDPTNDTQNVTARVYVNSVNVVNYSRVNLVTNNTHSNFTNVSQSWFDYNDVVYVNFLTIESANNSIQNQTNSTSWTILVSTSALIAPDAFDGLSEAGTEIGDFAGNLAPGFFKFLLLIGIAVAIVAVIVALIGRVKSEGIRGISQFKK